MSIEGKQSESTKDQLSKEKDKALTLVLGQIERNFGKGSIMRLGDCLLYTSPSPRDVSSSRMPSSA